MVKHKESPQPKMLASSDGLMPPQAVEFEKAIIGAALTETHAFSKIANELTSNDFYVEEHVIMFKALEALHFKHVKIDLLTASEQLRKSGDLEKVGGLFGVSQYPMGTASAANIEFHAAIVKEKSILRNCIRELQIGLAKCYEPDADAFELPKEIAYNIEVNTKINNPDVLSFEKVMGMTIADMEKQLNAENDILGLESSIRSLTDLTLGYKGPDLIILGAGTGEGKTTFALQEAFKMAESGKPVAFICLEMKAVQLARKILSAKLLEPIVEIRRAKNLTREKWVQLYELKENAKNIPLFIYDLSGLTVTQVVAVIKECKRKHKIEMAFVDYLGLMSMGDKFSGNREQEISKISLILKQTCMMLDLPIMVLAQLSREEKSGKPRLYRNSDLRDSGAIEQNADMTMFIYSPSKHGVKKLRESDPEFEPNDCLLIIDKNREGETGIIDLKFIKQHSKFIDAKEWTVNEVLEKHYKNYSEPEKVEESDDPNLPF